jgi:hypothetical protein
MFLYNKNKFVYNIVMKGAIIMKEYHPIWFTRWILEQVFEILLIWLEIISLIGEIAGCKIENGLMHIRNFFVIRINMVCRKIWNL